MTRRLATSMICVLISLVILRPTVFPSPTIAAQGAETATPPASNPSITPTATGELPPTDPPPTELPPTPTIVPSTATPTLVITEPPLTLRKSASVSRISAGNSFSYVLLIETSNAGARTIQMHTRLDKLLKINGASTSNGGCKTGNLIVCAVTARRNQPATITLSVRVIDNAPVGRFIVSQAIAQDDLYNTAASDQVVVEVVGDIPAPTRISQADSLPQAPPAEAGAPATGADSPAESAPQAPAENEGMPPAAQVEELPAEASPIPLASAPETGSTGLLEPLGSPAAPEYDTSFSAPQPANEAIEENSVPPALPVTAPQAPTLVPARVPGRAGPPPASIQAVPLPATTTLPPAIGVITALFGLGLVIRGARRVRQAGMWLVAQGAGVTQLQLLLRAATSRQRATAALIAGMERRSRLMTERLEAPTTPGGQRSGGNGEEVS